MVNRSFTSRFGFFFFASFLLAGGGYFILSLFIKRVFGVLYRMPLYHFTYPYQYIGLTCFIFALAAALIVMHKTNATPTKNTLLSLLVIIVTLAISSVLGGMLWEVHDMNAGYWPSFWQRKLLSEGPRLGLFNGWFIVLGSIPYNLFGIPIAIWLLNLGSDYFSEIKEESSLH